MALHHVPRQFADAACTERVGGDARVGDDVTAALLAKRREMQEALVAFRQSRATAASASQAAGQAAVEQRLARVSEAFDRVYQRHTGLETPPAAGADQAARLSELEALVRDQQIAERLARIKAGEA